MRKFLALFAFFSLLLAPVWGITADQLVKHFEDNQKWVQSAMVSFQVLKQTSDPQVADLYEFVSDKSYDYEGMVINGADFASKDAGPMANLAKAIGKGVLAVIHKLATDDNKKLFKPTWIGYNTPGDKRVSNWFCMIMGDHTKTYLTRVDQRSKLDEIGTDPLMMNILDKNLFKFEVVKDLGNRVTLRVAPKPEAKSNLKEAIVELAQLKIGNAETWYATKINGTLLTGATGVTEFGNFRVAIAPVGGYIAYGNDGSLKSAFPIMDIGTATKQAPANDEKKAFIFATQIKNTSYQKNNGKEYEVKLITTIKHLHINPDTAAMAQYIQPKRLETLEKVAKKVVGNH